MAFEYVRTADGRTIELLTEGAESGFPLVFHDGTPTAAAPFPLLDRLANDRDLRVVTWSRPGYAASTRQPGRSVAAIAADTTDVLDYLAYDEFVTLGWSGGGPHALACAALLPERCAAAATLASVAPFDAEGLDWYDGMAQENVDEFGAAAEGESLLVPRLEGERRNLAEVTGEEVASALGGLVSDVDVRALSGEFADTLAGGMRRAFSTGIDGWLDDDLAFVRPWGFELAGIRCPLAIWQGAQDRMVPFSHGKWLAAHLPAAQSHLLEDEGHLSLVAQLDRILDDLMTAAGRD